MSEQRPNGNANGPDRGDRGANGGGGERGPRRNGRNNPPGMKFGRGIFGWALFIGLVIMLFVVLKREQGNAYDLPVGQFRTEVDNGNIKTVALEADEASGEFAIPPAYVNGATKFKTTLTPGLTSQWEFIDWLTKSKTYKVSANNNNNLVLQFILPLIPWLLIFGFVWF